jgi:hypothetical protein
VAARHLINRQVSKRILEAENHFIEQACLLQTLAASAQRASM